MQTQPVYSRPGWRRRAVMGSIASAMFFAMTVALGYLIFHRSDGSGGSGSEPNSQSHDGKEVPILSIVTLVISGLGTITTVTSTAITVVVAIRKERRESEVHGLEMEKRRRELDQKAEAKSGAPPNSDKPSTAPPHADK